MHPIVQALLAAMHAHTLGTSKAAADTPDAHLAHAMSGHLSHAIALAKDPELKAHLAAAHLALLKHSATLSKEHQAALGGKMSPRMMAGN